MAYQYYPTHVARAHKKSYHKYYVVGAFHFKWLPLQQVTNVHDVLIYFNTSLPIFAVMSQMYQIYVAGTTKKMHWLVLR